jgi:hexosaminidase
MHDFVLTTDWTPTPRANVGGTLSLALTSRSARPICEFQLGLTTFFWISPGVLENGVVLQGSEFIIVPPANFVLAPGETWTVCARLPDQVFRRYSSLVRSAYVILAGDEIVEVEAKPPTRNGEPGAPKLGVMIPRVANVRAPVAVVPYPKSVRVAGARRDLSHGLRIAAGTDRTVAHLAARLFPADGLFGDEGIPIEVVVDREPAGSEAYRIHFAPDRVTLRAGAQQGINHGLITLAQIVRAARLAPSSFAFPLEGLIVDEARFSFRGLLLDEGRQVWTVDQTRRVLDVMAWHKLNVLHMHLSDDIGWRLDIPQYPQLVERAAYRGHGLPIPPSLGSPGGRYGNFYSRRDIEALKNHAAQLGIGLVPEIEMPAHAFALLQAMPDLRDPLDAGTNILNPALTQTYAVLFDILRCVNEVFDSSWIHLGGDEVPPDAWDNSSIARSFMRERGMTDTYELQSYFTRRIQTFVRDELGKGIATWEEAAVKGGGFDPERTYVTAWLTSGLDLARRGYDVVSTPNNKYYLDSAQSADWWSPGMDTLVTPETCYTYDPAEGWPEECASKLIGVQGCMWGEFSFDLQWRNYLIFPRLSAIAETAWTAAASKDYRRFIHLAGLLPTLGELNVV